MSAPVQFERYDSVLARRARKWVCATVISRATGPVAKPYTVQYDCDGKRADLAAGDVKRNPNRQLLSELGRQFPQLAALLAHPAVRTHNDAVLADKVLSRQGVLVGQPVHWRRDANDLPLLKPEHRCGVVVQACAPVEGSGYVPQYAVCWNWAPDKHIEYSDKSDQQLVLKMRRQFHGLQANEPASFAMTGEQLIAAFKTQVYGYVRAPPHTIPPRRRIGP